jgi:integrase
MARSVRSNPLETRTNRLKQVIGKRVYVSIAEGLALGYRRPEKGNGTWQARLWTGDKYVKHVLGEADDYLEADDVRVFTFFQAQDRARAYSEEIRRPALPRMKPASVTEASEHYLAWYRENRKALKETETTIKAHVLPAFGDRLLMDLDTVTIRRWHEKLASSPARTRTRAGGRQVYRDKPSTSEGKRSRKSTANRILTVLKAILNRAFRDGLVADDTAWRRVKPFENADEPVTRFLTEAESTRLINACRPDLRNLVKAALFTGARYGELNRLLVKDINLDTGMIYINPEAKSGRGRHVPLSDDGIDFFRGLSIGTLGSAYVFQRKDGEPWGKNHHVRLLEAACNKAKLEPAVGFHELRHTYASLLAQAGADLLTISKLLGHADTRITSRHYAHLCDKTLAKTVRALLPGFGHQAEAGKVRAIW